MPENYINNTLDIDDGCLCHENTEEALTNGGSCVDECGNCGGDGYVNKCSDLTYLRQNGNCLNMGCMGECSVIDSVSWYYHDYDNDFWGALQAGYMCSSDPLFIANSFSLQGGDMDDSTYCISNTIDLCGYCDGDAQDKSYCSDSNSTDKENCESAGSVWNIIYTGTNIDCAGVCYDENDITPDSLKAQIDECSSDTSPQCCGGNSGSKCSNYIDRANFNGNYDCLGNCYGDAIVDECGVCNGASQRDYNGNCIHIVYPGDTDMNKAVNVNDLIPIVNNWGSRILSRNELDIYGNTITSKNSWTPQGQPKTDLSYECSLYADANGDSYIDISDVFTVLKNLNKSHTTEIVADCSGLPRESDIDIYYSIFRGLPNGELKQSIANMFGFAMPPNTFEVNSNYPNPFNPLTTINYEVPNNANVLIQIYNVKGQKLIEHHGINLDAGYYSYTWDASEYSSGIYYYKTYYNDIFIENNKMILLK